MGIKCFPLVESLNSVSKALLHQDTSCKMLSDFVELVVLANKLKGKIGSA